MLSNKLSKLVTAIFASVLVPTLIHAGGPLLVFDAQNGIAFKYDVSSPVRIYTDLGPLKVPVTGNAVSITNERADELVAFGYQQWTDVPTSNFRAHVAGDFASLGLPDITPANASLVIGQNNGGGIHVIYDVDGTIMRDFFGVGNSVLGIAQPEIGVDGTNVITESWVVINGRTVASNDPNGLAYAGVFTHEFGHSVNLAHAQVNGAALITSPADPKGPAGSATLPYPGSPIVNDIETMYPFIATSFTNGSGVAQSTVDRTDDKVSISNLYPEPGYPGNNGSISGKITASNGRDEVTGVNVIARNIASPFADALSAMSGDYSRGELGPDGRFTLNGLTPGSQYVVYVDAVRSPNSYPTVSPFILPGIEEFFNGSNESGNGLTDNPCSATAVTSVAGQNNNASISFNAVKNGPSLTLLPRSTNITDLSRDGKIAVGTGIAIGSPSFRWTKETGFVDIGGGGGVTRISPEGGHIVGSIFLNGPAQTTTAFWNGGTNWIRIPNAPTGIVCPSSELTTWGVSSNGEAVAGSVYDGTSARQRPYRWSAATGTVILPVPDGTTIARANHISADGNTVVGRYTNPGVVNNGGSIWVNGQFVSLFTPANPTIGEATIC